MLPVDDSVTLSDSSASVDAVPVETSGIIEVGKAVSEDKDNWTPYNTTVSQRTASSAISSASGTVTRDFWENPLTNGLTML